MNDNQSKSSNETYSTGDISNANVLIGKKISYNIERGQVANTINSLPSSPEPNKPGLKELLTQLREAIESDESISDETKAEALEEVNNLGIAGKNQKHEETKKSAKKAINTLKGIVTGLPTVASCIKAFQDILPLITSIFGL